MCKPQKKETKEQSKNSAAQNSNAKSNESETASESACKTMRSQSRRGKRVKQSSLPLRTTSTTTSTTEATTMSRTTRVRSSLSKKHAEDAKSGGVDAILPSLAIVVVLGFAIVAKMGWRGRASIAGIDLGTTNSVICVQQQSEGDGVGKIECIPDPFNDSPIVPSIVSFHDPHHHYVKKDKDIVTDLNPHPSYVTVGAAAKSRIDSHPHHTVYHAKRVLGSTFDDEAVKELMNEVEFGIARNEMSADSEPLFRVPFHNTNHKTGESTDSISIPPYQVGSYVVNHLIQITREFLGHDNIKGAVIAVPAEFEPNQIQDTVKAFKGAGIQVTRILKEPEAAALAYGLQKKEHVEYILVYDFGGGTLDVSLLQVFDGGYIEVIGNDGDNHLGGADFDAAVAHLLLDVNDGRGGKIVETVTRATRDMEVHLKSQEEPGEEDIEEMLSSTCKRLQEYPLCTISSFHTMGERMKIELSSSMGGEDSEVQAICLGLTEPPSSPPESITELCSLLEPVKLSITLAQYDQACTKLFERSLSPIRRLLDDLDMQIDDIDEVVMVGGTTRMPQIRQMVQEELGVGSLNTSIDPDLTVAYGAASVID